jgi:dTDP-4-dehydrorhamnose reductase
VNLLITGISGYVGRHAGPLAAAAGYRVMGTFFSHAPDPAAVPGCEFVRASVEQMPALIADLRPDVILHSVAAWRTEAEAQAVIVEGTRGVASAAALVGARLVHMSTDLVFDGEHGPYNEASLPAPVNFYGAAKAAAERIVLELAPDAAIVRTLLVTCFDPPDPRTQLVLNALEERRPPVTLFTDEYRCPVRIEDLAAALLELLDVAGKAAGPFSGFLHVAGPGRLSRYELGLRIARYHGLAVEPGIVPGLSSEGGQPRPRDCTLDISLAQRVLHTALRPLP